MKLFDETGNVVGEIYDQNSNCCCGCIVLFLIIFILSGGLLSLLKTIFPFILFLLITCAVIVAIIFLIKVLKSRSHSLPTSDLHKENDLIIKETTISQVDSYNYKSVIKNEFIVLEYCETKEEPNESSETTGHFGKGTIINVDSEINNWAKFYNYSGQPRFIDLKYLEKRR